MSKVNVQSYPKHPDNNLPTMKRYIHCFLLISIRTLYLLISPLGKTFPRHRTLDSPINFLVQFGNRSDARGRQNYFILIPSPLSTLRDEL